MSNVRFASFLNTGGNDRGSTQPLYIYDVELPIATRKYQHTWLSRVSAGIQGALEQAYSFGLKKDRSDVGVYLEEFTTLEEYVDDEDTDRYIHDNRLFSETARVVNAKAEDAAQQIVSDTLATSILEDMYDEMEAPINWTKVWADLDAPAPSPKKIAVGTRVYVLNGSSVTEAIFDGLEGSYLRNGHAAGGEERMVPVSFVQAQNYQIEAFPLPQKVLNTRRMNWWARAKNNQKVEGLGRVKKDAILTVAVQLALPDFWA